MMRLFLLFFISFFFCVSCTQLKNSTKGGKDEHVPVKPSEMIPPHLRYNPRGDNKPIVIHEVESGVDPALIKNIAQGADLPTEDEIVWTDPDQFEQGLPELKEVLKKASTDGWLESYSRAKRASISEGKPLLIWFTNSKANVGQISAKLSRELFSNQKFEQWAKENIIRLRFDYNVKSPGGMSSEEASRAVSVRKRWLKKVKKKYRVSSYPTVLVLSPEGTVVGRERGYSSGQGDFFWGLIKTAVINANAQHKDYRKRMSKRGYRVWEGHQGRKVFAKLRAYQKGDLLLVEPDGTRLRTKEVNLSKADRDWLSEQKAKRGL